MGDYLLKLRKSRIDPDRLKITEYILGNIHDLKVGEDFFHSLLGESRLISRKMEDKILVSSVQTKTGIYKFKKWS